MEAQNYYKKPNHVVDIVVHNEFYKWFLLNEGKKMMNKNQILPKKSKNWQIRCRYRYKPELRKYIRSVSKYVLSSVTHLEDSISLPYSDGVYNIRRLWALFKTSNEHLVCWWYSSPQAMTSFSSKIPGHHEYCLHSCVAQD